MMSWQGERGSRHERGYGSKWVRLRDNILSRDSYLCIPCLSNDRPTPASQVDHIRPKAKGGTDDPENLQSICDDCHKAKTTEETRGRRRRPISADGWPTGDEQFGYSIPDGVRKSGIPVVLVVGPPASGKSYWVKQHAKEGDTIIDLDECSVAVGGVMWDTRRHIWQQAFQLRDRLIHDLHNKTHGTCYLIVTAPLEDERKAWRDALGDVTLQVIKTPEAECIARIRADPDRAEAANSQIGAVKHWWAVN